MRPQRSRPDATVMNLLRAAGPVGLPATKLVTVANLFGFTDATMQITLSQLIARALIESPESGHYRLTPEASGLQSYVDRWRLGELRVRPWRGDEWLLAHPEDDRPGHDRALTALGFRTVRRGLLARPNNLTVSLDELREQGATLGLAPDTLLLNARPQGEATTQHWAQAWQPARLEDDYRRTTAQLRASALRLPGASLEAARIETWRLLGKAIHKLANDPLLPAEYVDVGARLALWKAAVDYEQLSKTVWADLLELPDMTQSAPELAG